eukprot:m.319316 g.319316  ORF g.319316 m.319316 type:complete len:304 (+) comp23105_c0_seq1:151-1062(+)
MSSSPPVGSPSVGDPPHTEREGQQSQKFVGEPLPPPAVGEGGEATEAAKVPKAAAKAPEAPIAAAEGAAPEQDWRAFEAHSLQFGKDGEEKSAQVLLVFLGKSADCADENHFKKKGKPLEWANSISNLLKALKKDDFPKSVAITDAFPSVEDWAKETGASLEAKRDQSAAWLIYLVNKLSNVKKVVAFGGEAIVMVAHVLEVDGIRGRTSAAGARSPKKGSDLVKRSELNKRDSRTDPDYCTDPKEGILGERRLQVLCLTHPSPANTAAHPALFASHVEALEKILQEEEDVGAGKMAALTLDE